MPVNGLPAEFPVRPKPPLLPVPMALKLGEGSESYAPLARALIGGLTASVLLTVFLVPAGFYLAYRDHEPRP